MGEMKRVFQTFMYFSVSFFWWGRSVEKLTEHAKERLEGADTPRPWWQDLTWLLPDLVESDQDMLALANLLFAAYAFAASVAIAGCFGGLSEMEFTRLRERTLKFLLLKLVILLAVVPAGLVARGLDACAWTMWFTIMGYMHLIIGVTKDRLELLSTYPPVGISKYVPPFVLLLLVLAHNCFLAAQLWRHTEGSVNFAVWCLRMYDVIHIGLLGLKTFIRYSLYIVDMLFTTPQEGENEDTGPWGPRDARSTLLFHIIFVFDMLIYALLLVVYLHVWILHGFTLGLMDTVLVLDIRSVLHALHGRVRQYTDYHKVTYTLNNLFQEATLQALSDAGDCAICRNPMQTGKVLPCQHIFHLSCLRAWLQQCGAHNYNCPLCRMPLIFGQARRGREAEPGAEQEGREGRSHRAVSDGDQVSALAPEVDMMSEDGFSDTNDGPASEQEHRCQAAGPRGRMLCNTIFDVEPRPARQEHRPAEEAHTWSMSSLASSFRAMLTLTRTVTEAALGTQGAVAAASADDGEEVTSQFEAADLGLDPPPPEHPTPSDGFMTADVHPEGPGGQRSAPDGSTNAQKMTSALTTSRHPQGSDWAGGASGWDVACSDGDCGDPGGATSAWEPGGGPHRRRGAGPWG